MKKNKTEILKYINSLIGYEGYVQFSHRKIEKERDIFVKRNPELKEESGFIYEAHFYNETTKTSVAIKQVNESCLVSKTVLTDKRYDVSYEEYISDIEKFPKITMAQIWKAEPDTLCEGMEVKKLKKVVFAGFKSNSKVKLKEQKKTLYETLDKVQKEKLLKHFLVIFQPEYIDSLLKEEQ